MTEWKRPFKEEIEELKEQHPRLQQISAGESVLALPQEIVNDVGIAAKPWVSDEDQVAEAALTDMCKRYQAIGFFENRAVEFPLLGAPSPHFRFATEFEGVSESPGFEWATPAKLSAVDRMIPELDQIDEQQLGTTGYLVTCPQFLTERDEVRQRFDQAGFRSDIQLDRPLKDATGALSCEDEPVAGAEQVEAFESLTALYDRWGLSASATWDVPVPLGPQVGVPVPHSQVVPESCIQVTLPLHFATLHSMELHSKIAEMQRSAAKSIGLPEDYATLSAYTKYASYLKIQLYTNALEQRYAADGQPRGFAGWLEEMLAIATDLKVTTVRERRTEIKKRLDGYPAGS